MAKLGEANNKNDDLSQQITKLNGDITALKGEKEELEIKNSVLVQEKAELELLITYLNEKVNKLEKYTKHLQRINVSNL